MLQDTEFNKASQLLPTLDAIVEGAEANELWLRQNLCRFLPEEKTASSGVTTHPGSARGVNVEQANIENGKAFQFAIFASMHVSAASVFAR